MLAQFLALYRPHRRLFLIDFGCAILSGLLELGFPMAVRGFVDRLLPTSNWTLIVVASAALLAVYLINTALMAIVTYWGHQLGINIETELRRRAFAHIQRLSLTFFDNQRTGHLVARLTKDLEEVGEVAHHGPEDLFIAVMTFIGAFALMYAIEPRLALLTTLVVPVTAGLSTRYGSRMTRNWQALFARIGAFNAQIEETVGGIRVVQAFGQEAHENARFAADNALYRATKLDAYRLMATSTSLNYLSMRLTQLFVMVAGTWFVLNGALSNGGFVGFLLLTGVFFRPVEKIASVMETYPKGIAGFRRYLDLLAITPDVQDEPGATSAGPLRGHIRYQNVHFAYAPASSGAATGTSGRPILDNVTLDIEPGQTVAFVGPSGAGKTTICALLPRFYDPQSGAITIDGTDIRAMTLQSLRAQIGIVQQDVFLFSGTIADNIRYGRPGATDAQVARAADQAHLTATIAALPQGANTVVGERGVKLSGGQKQRLAIARLFLRDPAILILDEATSALDTETERAIQDALADLSRGRTTLVIAHRLATIRGADRIVVLDHGRVVEQGTHAQLLATGGLYRRLHTAQFAPAE